MKKHILHLITGLEVGGTETMLLRTLPLLQSHFDNHVCCIKGRGSIGKLLEEKGVPVYYLDLSMISAPILPLRFFRVIRKTNPDMLVTYLIHADIFGRIFGRIFGIRKIISNRRGFYLNWKSLHFLDRLTSHLATAFIVQTRFAKESLTQYFHCDSEKISIIPNPIDLSEFHFELDRNNKRELIGIPNKDITIVCIANLKPGKGLEELLIAYERCFPEFPQTQLLFVGDGPLHKALQKKIEKFQSRNNIHFLGRRDDVRELLRISDVFILPTYSEGMSNALLEAMASELAIITTDIEVNKELIKDNISGLLVPIQNSQAITDKMKLLIQNKDARITLGEQAYQNIVKKFEIKKVILLTKDTYERILYGT